MGKGFPCVYNSLVISIKSYAQLQIKVSKLGWKKKWYAIKRLLGNDINEIILFLLH